MIQMHVKKRLFSLLSALFIAAALCASLCTENVSAAEENASGTYINTESDLLSFLKGEAVWQNAETVILGKDLTVSTRFTPVNFSKTFLGNGHTITMNVAENPSLFQNITENGIVRNLVLSGTFGTKSIAEVAGICHENYGTIENCCIQATFTAGAAASGIAHHNYGLISTCAVLGQKEAIPGANWKPISDLSQGTVSNCCYRIVPGPDNGAYGKGYSDADCRNGNMLFDLQKASKNKENFCKWISDSNSEPTLEPESASAVASVFSKGTTIFVVSLVAVFAVALVLVIIYADRRQKKAKKHA